MRFETPGKYWQDYELIDSGDFQKLERFGNYIIARPEPKAHWKKSRQDWNELTHAYFKIGSGLGKPGIEDSGIWERPKMKEEEWAIKYTGKQKGLDFKLKLSLTTFKHIGIFPEQASNWEFIYYHTRKLVEKATSENKPIPKVLNLFAYTGAASLAAKAAGADVVHLDSIRQVVTWARENMELSNLDNIRWIVEDAMRFVRREAKRGNTYQGIILDPPAYGNGPKGEKWKLDDNIKEMLRLVNEILEKEDTFLVLNLYSEGYTAELGESLIEEAFGLNRKPKAYQSLNSGELSLKDSSGKVLPMSVFLRLVR